MVNVAAEDNVTPWEALLRSVRVQSARVAYVDSQVVTLTREFDPQYADARQDQRMRDWLAEARRERTLLGRLAKAAVDARVSEAVVRNLELEGRLMSEVLGEVLDALPLDHDQRVLALEVAQRKLLEVGTGEEPIR
jgi:hypothetical protein